MIAAALDERQREVVMANLIDLAMADGSMAGNEKEMLMQYLQAFGISEDKVKPIIETIAVKNNLGIF